MHRSRLSTLLIDVPVAEVQTAVAFWSAALGIQALPVPGEEQFTSLPGAAPGLVTAVQSVEDSARYHVDLETDDVEAEARWWRSAPWSRTVGSTAGRCGCRAVS